MTYQKIWTAYPPNSSGTRKAYFVTIGFFILLLSIPFCWLLAWLAMDMSGSKVVFAIAAVLSFPATWFFGWKFALAPEFLPHKLELQDEQVLVTHRGQEKQMALADVLEFNIEKLDSNQAKLLLKGKAKQKLEFPISPESTDELSTSLRELCPRSIYRDPSGKVHDPIINDEPDRVLRVRQRTQFVQSIACLLVGTVGLGFSMLLYDNYQATGSVISEDGVSIKLLLFIIVSPIIFAGGAWMMLSCIWKEMRFQGTRVSKKFQKAN